METPIKSLSGGNQQKVIIARWLLTNPDYLILDEPTRGIDVGTKTEIQKLVLDLADEGKAVTFISSEIEEMLRTCSRMAVLRDGKKVGELSGEQLNQADIMNIDCWWGIGIARSEIRRGGGREWRSSLKHQNGIKSDMQNSLCQSYVF